MESEYLNNPPIARLKRFGRSEELTEADIELNKRNIADMHFKNLPIERQTHVKSIIKSLNCFEEKEINYISNNLRPGIKLKWEYLDSNPIKNIDQDEALAFIKILRETDLGANHHLRDYINNDTLAMKALSGDDDYNTSKEFGELVSNLSSLYNIFGLIDCEQAGKEFIDFINSNTRKNCDKTIVIIDLAFKGNEEKIVCNLKLFSLGHYNKFFRFGGDLQLRIIDKVLFLTEKPGNPFFPNDIKEVEIPIDYLNFLDTDINVQDRFKCYKNTLSKIKTLLIKNEFYRTFSTNPQKTCNICGKASKGKNKASCNSCFEIMNLISSETGTSIETLKARLKIDPTKSVIKEKIRQKRYCNKLLTKNYSSTQNQMKIKYYLDAFTQ